MQWQAPPSRAWRAAALRSWLFVPGADEDALRAAARSGADVLMQELEDFTTPERRPAARALAAELFGDWRAAGAVAAVRVNPLEGDGKDDLAGVMRGAPDILLLPKVDDPDQVIALDAAVERWERDLGLPAGSTALVPNIESARGLLRTGSIATASPRVIACLVASEDMAADLGAERGRDGAELAYVRARFHLECRAAGVVSIDCPYTWRDIDGLTAETEHARRLGYTAKSAVVAEHAATINAVFTPSPDAVAEAARIVTAFEAARAAGAGTVELDGAWIELPGYMNAKRLLERARALSGGLPDQDNS